MMRFPLRLFIALSRARLAHGHDRKRALLQRIDPAEILHSGSIHPVNHEKLRAVLRGQRSSILWLAGPEPLDHPGIAHLVRAISKSGRTVFLETGGSALRRRIHEFQPLPNFFLIVRLDDTHPARLAAPLEGLRAARLSGFYTVAFSLLTSASTLSGLQSLNCSLEQLSVDGWLICATTEASRTLSAQARFLIPNARWRKLSQRLDRDLLERNDAALVSAAKTIPLRPASVIACSGLDGADSKALEESSVS